MADAAAAAPAAAPHGTAGSSSTKRFWSYEQIQTIIRRAVVEQDVLAAFQPTLIICIAAGGFVPTRILRSCLKHTQGRNVPIQTIGLQLYDIDGADPTTSPVQRTQWLSYGTGPGQLLLQGHNILLVDEVDDSRKTLSCAVSELQADIDREQQRHETAHPHAPWVPPQLGVFVVHNKQRPKLASLPDDLMRHRYFALDIPDCWCVYPWDADDIYAHTQAAERNSSGGGGSAAASALQPSKRQSSGCPALTLPPHANSSSMQANGACKAAAAAVM